MQEKLNLLRQIKNKSQVSQRELSLNLGFSLGKLNYCLVELKKKGLVKFNNFSKQKKKIKYVTYILTPKGLAFRAKLTYYFMKKKIKEYEELKREFKSLNKNDKK